MDDLAVMCKNPDQFFSELKRIGNYQLKGNDLIKYHIGGDFYRDADGILCYGAKTYVERLLENFKVMFPDEKIKPYTSPLEPNDHPELDLSPE